MNDIIVHVKVTHVMLRRGRAPTQLTMPTPIPESICTIEGSQSAASTLQRHLAEMLSTMTGLHHEPQIPAKRNHMTSRFIANHCHIHHTIPAAVHQKTPQDYSSPTHPLTDSNNEVDGLNLTHYQEYQNEFPRGYIRN